MTSRREWRAGYPCQLHWQRCKERPTLRHRAWGTRREEILPKKRLHPQSTEPPFTLMISPVMKLARSEATKRIGPATSSAVAARPSGIAAATIFCPALESSTALDMSVATHPGATEFTRIPYGANSVARPLVSAIIAPLDAP